MLVTEEKIKYVKRKNFISERLLPINIKGNDNEGQIITVANGLNEDITKEKSQQFEVDKVIILEDLNGRVRNKNTGIEWCFGKNTETVRHKNQKRIKICLENQLKIGNLHFMTKEIHKITRQILSRNEKLITD